MVSHGSSDHAKNGDPEPISLEERMACSLEDEDDMWLALRGLQIYTAKSLKEINNCKESLIRKIINYNRSPNIENPLSQKEWPIEVLSFLFKVRLRQKYYALQVQHNRGLNPWLPDRKKYISCPWDAIP